MQRGRFSKSSFKNIAAFQLAGYSAWNGEGAGSSPACYTVRWAAMFQRLAKNICNVLVQGSIPWRSTIQNVRLMAEDATLSMWRYGFESRMGYIVG